MSTRGGQTWDVRGSLGLTQGHQRRCDKSLNFPNRQYWKIQEVSLRNGVFRVLTARRPRMGVPKDLFRSTAYGRPPVETGRP